MTLAQYHYFVNRNHTHHILIDAITKKKPTPQAVQNTSRAENKPRGAKQEKSIPCICQEIPPPTFHP
jgi:hypothetical protein